METNGTIDEEFVLAKVATLIKLFKVLVAFVEADSNSTKAVEADDEVPTKSDNNSKVKVEFLEVCKTSMNEVMALVAAVGSEEVSLTNSGRISKVKVAFEDTSNREATAKMES